MMLFVQTYRYGKECHEFTGHDFSRAEMLKITRALSPGGCVLLSNADLRNSQTFSPASCFRLLNLGTMILNCNKPVITNVKKHSTLRQSHKPEQQRLHLPTYQIIHLPNYPFTHSLHSGSRLGTSRMSTAECYIRPYA